jgi:dTDP-4-amino-4,6-dideoxygalactose transaminase
MDPKPAILGSKPAFDKMLQIIRPMAGDYWRTKELRESYDRIFESNQLTGGFEFGRKFEEEFVKISGAEHAVALSSCTAGLMLAIQYLGAADREIIMPSFTFSATAHAAAWNRCKIRFADIDDTLCLDPADVERKITPHTALILAVHMYGCPCHPETFESISKKTGVPVLYDAAHAVGATANGKGLGAFGTANVYSFSPTKLITTVEGGVLVTNDDGMAEAVRLDRNYSNLPDYQVERPGLSARMGEPYAALGLAQLPDLPRFVQNREGYVQLYKEILGAISGVSFQNIPRGYQSSHKDFSIFIDPKPFGMNRDQLAAALKIENIDTRRYFYPPIHQLDPYRKFHEGGLSNTERRSERVLSLPIYNEMDEGMVEGICEAIRRIRASARAVVAALEK